jgi:hypothetical protein
VTEPPPGSPSYADVKALYDRLGTSMGGGPLIVSIRVSQLPSRGTTWLDAHVRFVKRTCAIGWGVLASGAVVYGGLAWLTPSAPWFTIMTAIFIVAIVAGALVIARNLTGAARAFQDGRPPPGKGGTPPPPSDDGRAGRPGSDV